MAQGQHAPEAARLEERMLFVIQAAQEHIFFHRRLVRRARACVKEGSRGGTLSILFRVKDSCCPPQYNALVLFGERTR